MSEHLLVRLLAGTLPDPDGGGMLSLPKLSIVIDRQLADVATALLEPLGLPRSLAIVMDPDTRNAMGARVSASLAAAGSVEDVLLSQRPHPDMETVCAVVERTRSADALVAVGSGSINDIAKYAAHLAGKPYVVFGTAPSMNGYTSVAAAISENGLKKSLAATLPLGVFLDLDVMARAPQRLVAAGFGDSLARSTAQTDWLLAHLLLNRPYRETPFMLLADDEDALVANAAALRSGDTGAMALLVRTLVMSGLGMTLCGGSYPASQGEHLIAHYIDMRGAGLPPAYHGEHIAVTTLTMARLQEQLLAKTRLRLSPTAETRDTVIATFGPEVGAACWDAFRGKVFNTAQTAVINRRLDAEWPAIRRHLRSVGRSSVDLEQALVAVGAPTTPADVAIPADFYDEAVRKAHLIRDRFTALDMIATTEAWDA